MRACRIAPQARAERDQRIKQEVTEIKKTFYCEVRQQLGV